VFNTSKECKLQFASRRGAENIGERSTWTRGLVSGDWGPTGDSAKSTDGCGIVEWEKTGVSGLRKELKS